MVILSSLHATKDIRAFFLYNKNNSCSIPSIITLISFEKSPSAYRLNGNKEKRIIPTCLLYNTIIFLWGLK